MIQIVARKLRELSENVDDIIETNRQPELEQEQLREDLCGIQKKFRTYALVEEEKAGGISFLDTVNRSEELKQAYAAGKIKAHYLATEMLGRVLFKNSPIGRLKEE